MSCISKLKKMILMLISLNCLISSVYAEESSCLMWGFSVEGFPLSKNQLIQLEQDTGIKSKLIQFYLQWPLLKDPYTTIHSTLEAIDSLGAIPCITWEPMTLDKNNSENIILYQSIMNGHYDDYMQKVANELKNWKKTLIIRFAHEMNIKRYHWGTTEDEYGPNSPEIYIKMFRYIVSFFKKNNVDNVLWAFCPNVDSIPNESWNQIKNYYPGDDYVGILGMDGYNWAITPELAKLKKLSWTKPWMTFEQLFQDFYRSLKSLAPDKPIIIFETACPSREENKDDWIKEGIKTAKRWNLIGIIWFQIKKEEDWRIQINSKDIYIHIMKETQSNQCFFDLKKSNHSA